MNDFTKDELHTLLKCIRLAEIDHGECADLDNVKFKIRCMIDSYCEHDKQELDCDGGISMVCSNCGITTMDI